VYDLRQRSERREQGKRNDEGVAAKKQSEELKALFEQSRIVATESAGIAKRDYEKKTARLTQALSVCEGERDTAHADKQDAEEKLQGLLTRFVRMRA